MGAKCLLICSTTGAAGISVLLDDTWTESSRTTAAAAGDDRFPLLLTDFGSVN